MRSRTSTWFETKVKYQKTMEDGSEKVVSEAYVVDALSFTEAESAIIDEMSVYVSGELKVSGIGKAGYGEIFFSDVDDDDKWYKAKLQFITIDEKSEKEKRSNVTYLVQAKSLARSSCCMLPASAGRPCPQPYRPPEPLSMLKQSSLFMTKRRL